MLLNVAWKLSILWGNLCSCHGRLVRFDRNRCHNLDKQDSVHSRIVRLSILCRMWLCWRSVCTRTDKLCTWGRRCWNNSLRGTTHTHSIWVDLGKSLTYKFCKSCRTRHCLPGIFLAGNPNSHKERCPSTDRCCIQNKNWTLDRVS
jgi:hypothetical protein